jgi:uncharacterized membrane protein
MNWYLVFHAVHVLAAGIWLGGLVFTTAVVSPAFRRMAWSPEERIAVRSAVGRQYSRIAGLNLALLFVAALADWLPVGAGTTPTAELCLIVLVLLLSGLHGRVLAPRLAQASREAGSAGRPQLLRVSSGVSVVNLMFSVIIVVLSSLRTF